MPFNLGPVELGLILLIVAMLFGVGKLPEVFGSIGKGVREFRKESGLEDGKSTAGTPQVLPPAQAPMAQLPVNPSVATGPVTPVNVAQPPVNVAQPPVNVAQPPASDAPQSYSDRALG